MPLGRPTFNFWLKASPMDAHVWGKCIQNSPNLLKNLQGTCLLDTQL